MRKYKHFGTEVQATLRYILLFIHRLTVPVTYCRAAILNAALTGSKIVNGTIVIKYQYQ